jgi:ATP-binding cassette, subfamily B, bacterial
MVFGLSTLLGSAISVIGVVIALLVIQPILIPLLLMVFFPAWLVASRRGEAFHRFYWQMTPSDRERHYLAGLLTDRDAAKEILGFGLAARLRRRYATLYEERIGGLRSVAHQQLAFSLIANAGIGVMLLAVLMLVGWLTLSGRVDVAEAGVAVAAVVVAGSGLARAGYAAGALSEASLYLDDYLAFRDLLPQVRAARPTGPAPSGFSRIAAAGVTFSYPNADEAALHEVDLHIDAGEVVALVGENGSGKTTLAKLLAGLYTPDGGRITWDGADLGGVDPDALRRKVAVIFQDFVRYHLPLRDNVVLGASSGDHGVLRQALTDAGGLALTERLHWDTVLSAEYDGGTDLSGGEWQRVALARALAAVAGGAGVLVLDEPTASLDVRAEAALFERFLEVTRGVTTILVSHRLSSVRHAERIVVLADPAENEHGVVEDGSHDELMRLGGRYADLFALQARRFTQDDEATIR